MSIPNVDPWLTREPDAVDERDEERDEENDDLDDTLALDALGSLLVRSNDA